MVSTAGSPTLELKIFLGGRLTELQSQKLLSGNMLRSYFRSIRFANINLELEP
jgi:hypothetical protein